MSQIVVVEDKIDVLPFHKALTWERFQALCTDVLYKKFASADSREYLMKGSDQKGIDVYSIQRGEAKISVAQCKLVEYLGPKQILDIIDEFLVHPDIVKDSKEFILCTSADLGRQRDEDKTISDARKKLAPSGIDFIVWDERGLSKELRTNATPDTINIVYRYFNEPIALAFYGKIWSEYVSTLRLVEKRQYSSPEYYIERSIVSYKEEINNKNDHYWNNWIEKEKETLISLLEKNSGKESKRIMLLSTAGFGKTEEINNLAGYFSDKEKLTYPIRFYLRDYEGQTVEEILTAYNTNWKNINPENLLLIFDGLDEIGTHHFQAYINELNAFVELNPKVQIINSSRYNFYDVRQPQLRAFEIFLLNPLTPHDIEQYIEDKLENRVDEFKQKLHQHGFSEYIQNPYYLTRLVRFYNDKSLFFPNNKSQLFDRILFEQLDKDESKYSIPELKNTLLPVAKQIAFCMTLSGKSSLTDDEFKSIVTDPETRKLLNHFSVLNRNSASIGTWSFEHKNLQEYLCAAIFSTLPFEDIKKIISFEFNRNKLIPRFLNTISFLFELLDNNSDVFKMLFSWLNENEPELLVRFEKEQLSKATRFEIFKRIFFYYKEKQLTLRVSINFSHEEIARFVEVDDKVIDYLEHEIKASSSDNLAYDVLSIISYCERAFRYEQKLTNLLFDILTSNNYSYQIRAKAIEIFIVLGFINRNTFEAILNSGVELDNYEIRKACIFFISHFEYFEEYSKFIIGSISILEDGQKSTGNLGIYYALKPLLLKFHSPQKIKELFQYFLKDKSCISRHHHYREFGFELDEIKTLMQKAAEAYKSEPSILLIVYRLFFCIEYLTQDNNLFLPFKEFFEKTIGTEIIFKKFYRYDKKQRDIMSFANVSVCDFLIDEYKKGNLTDEEIRVYRNVLSWTNQDLFKIFYEKLAQLGNEYFVINDYDVDYIYVRLLQKEKNQAMLLDKSLFIEEVESIFRVWGKEEISPRDFWYSEDISLRMYQGSIVLDAIRDMCIHDDDRLITKQEFLIKYQQDNEWNGFVIDMTVEILKDKEVQIIQEQLLANLRKWLREQIESLNFENCIKDVDDTHTHVPLIEFVKRVYLLIDIDLEDKLLLKMLPSDYTSFFSWKDDSQETISSKVVKQVKDKDLLHQTVISNIKNLNLAAYVLSSHYTICYKLHYKECLSDLYRSVTSNNLIKDYNRVTLTEYYLSLGGDIQDFTSYLKIPEVETKEAKFISWHWFLIERLQFIETKKVTEILLQILSDKSQNLNKIGAAEYLIQLSRIEGLEYWAVYIKENKDFPFEHHWSNLQQYIVTLPVEPAIEIFIDVLNFTYKNGLQKINSNSFNIQDSLHNSLVTLSNKSLESHTTIKAEIERIIAENLSSDFVETMKIFSERLTQQYYESQGEEMTLEKASNIYFSISPLL